MATIVVACGQDMLIGKGNKLPWHIPEDLALFKRRTTNQAVIMGHKTYDCIPDKFKPLPKRKNIVVTRNPDLKIENVTCVTTPEAAIQAAAKLHPYVIGGSEIFQLFLEKGYIDRMLVSYIHGDYNGDVYFPYIDLTYWSPAVVSRFKDFNVVDYQPIHQVRKERDGLVVEIEDLRYKEKWLQSRVKQYEKYIRKIKKEGILYQ